MKKLLLIAFVIICSYFVKAQNIITVQNGGTPSFYSILDTAITHAQNGDTVYIPGGAWAVNNSTLTIDKELHIIGMGHNPDSTITTGMTKINAANLHLVSGANSSSLEGLYLIGFIYSGSSTSNEDVDNIKISRCRIDGNIVLSRLSTDWIVTENIINGYIHGASFSTSQPYAQSNCFFNNIIEQQPVFFGPNNIFRNNIMLSLGAASITSSVFENNIFITNNLGISSCTFNNNLCAFNYTIPNDCIGDNNIINQTITSIFINFSGNGSFSYTDDYHLQSTCPGKNAGTDGTDIGIYGGNFPWKAGSVPFNPHFITKTISGTTNSNGSLPVNITIGAQDH